MKLFVLFLLISYFNIFNQQDCGMNPPNQIDDCFQRQEYGDYHCCYFTDVSNSILSFCKLVNKSLINNLVVHIGETIYSMICVGNSTDTKPIGSDCANVKDPDPINCYAFSTDINSCCYYKNQNENTSKCFWLGYFSDIIHEFQNTTDLNVTVSCVAEYYNALIVIIFLFLF